jgi:hypothetical protein
MVICSLIIYGFDYVVFYLVINTGLLAFELKNILYLVLSLYAFTAMRRRVNDIGKGKMLFHLLVALQVSIVLMPYIISSETFVANLGSILIIQTANNLIWAAYCLYLFFAKSRKAGEGEAVMSAA